MSKSPDELLAMPAGRGTVGGNIRHAVESGALVETADGGLQFPNPAKKHWMFVNYGPSLGCDFLFHFMFRQVYAETAVPHGCRNCYKVKVAPRTLRELVAAWQIAQRIECRSKWGVDLNNPYSQHVYAGYFYVPGLEAARTLYKVVREAFAADAKLGPGLAVTIKRGCSEYEIAVGPSDQYAFTPEMAELEAHLKTRFRSQKAIEEPQNVLAGWIDTAYRIGDNTYLDFTKGRRRRAKTVIYTPE